MAKRKVKKFKLKTHKATAKRFRVTGTGLVVRTRQGKSHFRRRKSGRVLRAMDKVIGVHNSKQAKRIRTLAPYLGKYRSNPPAS